MSAHGTRRHFMKTLGLAAGAALTRFWEVPGALADELARTPRMTEGPFYPDRIPLDADNDLIVVNGNLTPAVGEITDLTGRILDRNGNPVNNAVVEIWQCDANAVYLHSSDSGRGRRDTNFQGFGRFTTGRTGEYRFRTIKPIPYPGRPAPHIHFMVKRNGREVLTTQCFINGHANNSRDMVFRELRTVLDRELVLVDFRPLPDSWTAQHRATFDIVLGRTPEMPE